MPKRSSAVFGEVKTKRKRSGTITLVIGLIAGVYALAQAVRFPFLPSSRVADPHNLTETDAYHAGQKLGSLSGLVIGGIISVVCLWSAFRYRKPASRRKREPEPDWLTPELYHPPAVVVPNASAVGNTNDTPSAPDTRITVSTTISAPLAEVWRAWMTEAELAKWNAEPDEAGMGFDFAGTYTAVVPHERIEAEFGGRKLVVEFIAGPDGVTVRETFDAEETHPVETQRAGWQAILDRFARHVEGRG